MIGGLSSAYDTLGVEKSGYAAVYGDRNVVLQGATIAQQCIKAGLIEEIELHLVPILLTEGIRLFDQVGGEPIELGSVR
jgi:dihydrofolate reductase